MDNLISAFIFFYGVTWAAALSTVTRFESFNTQWWGQGKGKRFWRCIVSFLICNALPIAVVGFAVGYRERLDPTPDKLRWWEVVAAASASLSVFSMSRVLHGVLLFLGERIYEKEEFATAKTKWSRNSAVEKDWTWQAHLWAGVGYFLVPLIVSVGIVLTGNLLDKQAAERPPLQELSDKVDALTKTVNERLPPIAPARP